MNKNFYLTSGEYLQLFCDVFERYVEASGWDKNYSWHPDDMKTQADVVHEIMFLTLDSLNEIRKSA